MCFKDIFSECVLFSHIKVKSMICINCFFSQLFSFFCRPKLPEYLLDFGYVVLGTQQTHVVRATNTGWFPVSFKIERGNIHSMGFIVELDRVRNLPGAPDNETVDFVVTFDPRAANLQLGPVETVVFINVRAHLCACVCTL